MWKRKTYKIILLLLIIVMASVLVSCNKDAGRKPDISLVMEQYELAAQKKATSQISFAVDFNFSIDKLNFNFKIAQLLDMQRIYNQGKVVIDMDAYVGATENMAMIELMLGYLNIGSLPDDFKDYVIKKDTMFNFLAGYDGIDTYNLKTAYYKKVDEKEYQNFIGITDSTLNQYKDAVGYEGDNFNVKEMIMLSDFLGIANNNSFVNDSASRDFNEAENAFMYNFMINNANLKAYFVEMFEAQILANIDQEEYAEVIALYNQLKTTVLKWFNVENSSIRVRATSTGKLTSMATDLKFKIEIPNGELGNALKTAQPDVSTEILALANLFKNISIVIDVKINENFTYDNISCSLEKYLSTDILKSASESVHGREIIPFREFEIDQE